VRIQQESPAIANKPARRESIQKLLQFDVKTSCRQVNDLLEVQTSRSCLQLLK